MAANELRGFQSILGDTGRPLVVCCGAPCVDEVQPVQRVAQMLSLQFAMALGFLVIHEVIFLLEGHVLVKRGHEGGLCRTVAVQREVVVEEGVAQVEMEDGLVAVIRGMSLVDREVPIHEQGFQAAAATKIAQASVGSSNVTSPLHHRPRVEQTQPPTEAEGIRAREKGPNVLQVQCAADSDKGIRHAEGTL